LQKPPVAKSSVSAYKPLSSLPAGLLPRTMRLSFLQFRFGGIAPFLVTILESFLLQEDGGHILLEDGVSALLIEQQ